MKIGKYIVIAGILFAVTTFICKIIFVSKKRGGITEHKHSRKALKKLPSANIINDLWKTIKQEKEGEFSEKLIRIPTRPAKEILAEFDAKCERDADFGEFLDLLVEMQAKVLEGHPRHLKKGGPGDHTYFIRELCKRLLASVDNYKAKFLILLVIGMGKFDRSIRDAVSKTLLNNALPFHTRLTALVAMGMYLDDFEERMDFEERKEFFIELLLDLSGTIGLYPHTWGKVRREVEGFDMRYSRRWFDENARLEPPGIIRMVDMPDAYLGYAYSYRGFDQYPREELLSLIKEFFETCTDLKFLKYVMGEGYSNGKVTLFYYTYETYSPEKEEFYFWDMYKDLIVREVYHATLKRELKKVIIECMKYHKDEAQLELLKLESDPELLKMIINNITLGFPESDYIALFDTYKNFYYDKSIKWAIIYKFQTRYKEGDKKAKELPEDYLKKIFQFETDPEILSYINNLLSETK